MRLVWRRNLFTFFSSKLLNVLDVYDLYSGATFPPENTVMQFYLSSCYSACLGHYFLIYFITLSLKLAKPLVYLFWDAKLLTFENIHFEIHCEFVFIIVLLIALLKCLFLCYLWCNSCTGNLFFVIDTFEQSQPLSTCEVFLSNLSILIWNIKNFFQHVLSYVLPIGRNGTRYNLKQGCF